MGWQHFRLTDHVIEHKLLLIVNSLYINAKSSDFTLIEKKLVDFGRRDQNSKSDPGKPSD